MSFENKTALNTKLIAYMQQNKDCKLILLTDGEGDDALALSVLKMQFNNNFMVIVGEGKYPEYLLQMLIRTMGFSEHQMLLGASSTKDISFCYPNVLDVYNLVTHVGMYTDDTREILYNRTLELLWNAMGDGCIMISLKPVREMLNLIDIYGIDAFNERAKRCMLIWYASFNIRTTANPDVSTDLIIQARNEKYKILTTQFLTTLQNFMFVMTVEAARCSSGTYSASGLNANDGCIEIASKFQQAIRTRKMNKLQKEIQACENIIGYAEVILPMIRTVVPNESEEIVHNYDTESTNIIIKYDAIVSAENLKTLEKWVYEHKDDGNLASLHRSIKMLVKMVAEKVDQIPMADPLVAAALAIQLSVIQCKNIWCMPNTGYTECDNGYISTTFEIPLVGHWLLGGFNPANNSSLKIAFDMQINAYFKSINAMQE